MMYNENWKQREKSERTMKNEYWKLKIKFIDYTTHICYVCEMKCEELYERVSKIQAIIFY